MRNELVIVIGVALASLCATGRPAAAASCESLATLSLPHTTITLANVVDAGQFVPFPALGRRGGAAPAGAAQGRGRGAPPSPFADLPSFCRVTATLMPSADSEIKVELWMPVTGWNGKFVDPGQRRLRGHHQPDRTCDRATQWLCRRHDRHGPRGRKRAFHARPIPKGCATSPTVPCTRWPCKAKRWSPPSMGAAPGIPTSMAARPAADRR